nr:MAG TPA: hypothetical protein [Caudoviricetes sp.]
MGVNAFQPECRVEKTGTPKHTETKIKRHIRRISNK